MKFLAKRFDQYVPNAKPYKFPIVINEFERSILKEIDYTQEFNNMKQFYSYLRMILQFMFQKILVIFHLRKF